MERLEHTLSFFFYSLARRVTPSPFAHTNFYIAAKQKTILRVFFFFFFAVYVFFFFMHKVHIKTDGQEKNPLICFRAN